MTQFTPGDRERINRAVADAEKSTVAEIVPVISESSGRYDRAEDAWGACLGLLMIVLVDTLLIPGWHPHGHWQELHLWPIALKLLGFLIGAALGIAISSRLPALRKLFTSRRELTEEVNARARQIFFDQRIHHTGGRSGVLIYISLLERQAVVLADEVVLQTLGQEFVNRWCTELTQMLKSGSVIDSLEKSIASIGGDLAKALPGEAHDRNELPDALITSGI